MLADVDPITMNIDPERVADAIGPRTRAILPVHFAGRPCEMDALCELARDHDLMMIEDCAHSIESTYHGRHVGTFGDYGCFSFYVTKNLATGEGGMVLAAEEAGASLIKTLALHGMSQDERQTIRQPGPEVPVALPVALRALIAPCPSRWKG